MLSNQVLHKTIQNIRRIAGCECSVWNMSGECIVTTAERLKNGRQEILDFLADATEGDERITEIAGMIAGETINEAAISNAKSLLKICNTDL